MWIFLSLVVAVIAIPVVIEASRAPMDEDARADAPGQFASLDKGVVHFQWFGPESGPVLVCIHGLTTPSFVWKRILQGLAVMGFRVLTYDHYGRGYSDRPRGLQNAKFFNDALDDLLAHEGMAERPVSLLGYSMGGAIAAAYAARNTHRITRLMLIAPAGIGDVQVGLVRIVSRLPLVGDWLMLAIYPWVYRRGIADEADAEIGALQERELNYRGFVRSVLSSLRGVLARPHKKAHITLASQGMPMLAIWGDADTTIPITGMARLKDWNPKADNRVVEGAAHDLTYARPEEVLNHIRSFIALSKDA